MLKYFGILMVSFLIVPFSGAHEGHDKTPGTLAAPHGGVVKGTANLYLELVSQSGVVLVYPFDHDMKAVATKDVKLEATMTLPKKSKSEPVMFNVEGDAFSAKIDAKGSHRFMLDVLVTYAGKKEKVKFNVEPQ